MDTNQIRTIFLIGIENYFGIPDFEQTKGKNEQHLMSDLFSFLFWPKHLDPEYFFLPDDVRK